METAVIFILARMEITAVLYFLRKGVKLHFYSLGTIFEENMRGVQRGESLTCRFGRCCKMRCILRSPPEIRTPWLWVSNRGEKHPCWHTILLAKSSVLYLLRPLTLERGCPYTRQTLFGGSRTGGFCGL